MKKYLIVICTITLLLLSVMLTGCSSNTEVALEPYISVRYQGNNGTATAVFDFDYADFEYAVMSQWDEKEQNLENLADLTKLELTMNCQPAKLEGLRNGDEIHVSIAYDKALAKELGYSFHDTEKTFTVTGLQEAIPVDPFDPAYFTVEITGFDPKLSIEVGNTADHDNPLRRVRYDLDKDYNLRNGDTVTITAEFAPGYKMDAYALTRTEATVTIENQDCFITDVATLAPEDIATIREKALDFFRDEDYLNIIEEDGSTLSLGGENCRRATDPAFLPYGYSILESGWDTEGTLVLPFQTTVKGAQFSWWKGDYYEVPLEMDLDLYGYFEIRGLRQTADGKLIREGSFQIQMDYLHYSESEMEQAAREIFPTDVLTEGMFQS